VKENFIQNLLRHHKEKKLKLYEIKDIKLVQKVELQTKDIMIKINQP